MAGQHVATVLNAELTLEEAFHQVAPGAEHAHGQAQSQPGGQAELGEEVGQYGGHDQTEHAAADAAHPRLVGRDAFEQLGREVAVKHGPTQIGSCVAGPKKEEYAQGVDWLKAGDIGQRIVLEGKHRKEGEAQCHVDL